MFQRRERIGGRRAALVALVLLLAASDAAAVSQSTAIGLTFPVGSQYSATGEAGTAVNTDVTAQWWNLGGLAFAADDGRRNQAHAMYSKLVPDLADDVALYWIGGSTVLEGWGNVGAAITYLDQGEQVQTDEAGDIGETFNSSEWALQASYAFKFVDNVGVGIGLKYVRISLAPEGVLQDRGASGEGSSWAVDAGVLWDVDDEFAGLGDVARAITQPLSIGATITNVGGDVTFVDEQQADPLPRNYRIGLAYDVFNTTTSRLTLIYDFMDMLVEGDETQVNGYGAEWTYANLLSVRAGYKDDPEGDIQGTTWGFGFDLERAIGTPLSFDYARVPQAEDLDEVDRFSLAIRF